MKMRNDDKLDVAVAESVEVLQPLFSKPKLTLALLRRPPFKLIHRIVMAVIQETGFPDGYFSDNELDVEKAGAQKASKVAFLDKLIALVDLCEGRPCSAISARVVSGLDSVETNKLLVVFGRAACDKCLNRKYVIKCCLERKTHKDFPVGTFKLVSGELFLRSEDICLQDASNNDGHDISGQRLDELVDAGRHFTPKGEIHASILKEIASCDGKIATTRSMVERLGITESRCADKHLQRPKFHFIHDLFMAVARKTGCALSFLSKQEMDYALLADKASRIEFVKKVVVYVETRLGIEVHVSPVEVVSGLEPERTNSLLQLIVVSAGAVQTTKGPLLSMSVTAEVGKDSGAGKLDVVKRRARVMDTRDAAKWSSGELRDNEPHQRKDEASCPPTTAVLSSNTLLDGRTGDLDSPKKQDNFSIISATPLRTSLERSERNIKQLQKNRNMNRRQWTSTMEAIHIARVRNQQTLEPLIATSAKLELEIENARRRKLELEALGLHRGDTIISRVD